MDNIETTVLRMWTDLGLRVTSTDDDFFDLGGQSLTLVRFIAAVHDAYGVEAPIDALLERDLTVAHAADVIRATQLAEVDDEQLTRALAELNELSDEQVAALLAGKG